MAKTTVKAEPEIQAIVITRIFNAPRERVWNAWTDPEKIKLWWGPAGFTAPSIRVDLRVGGKYIYAMRGPAGTEWDKVMYTAGTFKEIVPNEKIVVRDYLSDKDGNKLSSADYGQDPAFPTEHTITISFESMENGRTRLSIAYPRPESEEQYQAMLKSGMVEGWNQSLDKMAETFKR